MHFISNSRGGSIMTQQLSTWVFAHRSNLWRDALGRRDIKITRQNATYDRLELSYLVRGLYLKNLGSTNPNHNTDPNPNYNPNPKP